MKRILAVLVLALLLFSAVPVSAGQGREDKKSTTPASNGVYIVRLLDDPVVAYKGGVPGLKATQPKKGQKIDPNSPDVINYVSYLNGKQDSLVNNVGGRKLYSYVYAFSGFAAQLTDEQAARLAGLPGVADVSPDTLYQLDTSSTPAFLGLTEPNTGLWSKGYTGENVIIGIVDSGIWPESASFSDRTGLNGNGTQDSKLDYLQIPGWHGRCIPGDEFTAANCNQKLIGARYYNSGWGGNDGIDELFPYEYNSPRDADGHGTHTSSTAGGNRNVPASGAAAVFGSISGIAPRARIATYKVCWGTGDEGGCFGADSVAAIDQAVADGVDVINFSISGTLTNFRDPVEIAFLFAADAGVFVAASAGNSGPSSSTVAHPSPWLTTVAAGTHNRDGQGSVTLGNGATYFGASVATPVSAPLIDSTAAGLPGADPSQLALCYGAADGKAVLDPALVAGKIVVCDRGVTARVNKSLAVLEAGGLGMILVNTNVNSLNADFHFVPTVHLQSTDRAAVKAYAATPGATASISQGVVVYNAPAPFTASFSSRGPLLASADLLKPDLMAPGQDILAAVSPAGHAGNSFDLLSGTSMSSPHVAGLAALLKGAHRDWSPMAIKSALMTTANDVLDGPNTNPTVIFRQGAGHVRPNLATDPGLVFDAGWNDWLGFICGTQPGPFCSSYRAIDPSNYNGASIAIGDLAGVQTVTRTVKNVSVKETYTVSTTGFTGVSVDISPDSFTLNPGQEQKLTIIFTRTSATLGAYTGGQITWTGDKGHSVRIPAVIRPLAVAAPAEVSGSGASGSLSFPVTFGYTGTYAAGVHGLNPATTLEGTVADDPTDNFVVGGPGVTSFPVTIPAGTLYSRFQLFDEYTDGEDDLDLYVYNSAGQRVGSSGGGSSAEVVNLVVPAAGTYTVYVHGWQTDGPDANFTLFTWNVGLSDNPGNMSASGPATVTVGSTSPVDVNWTGLSSGKYLGAVSHNIPALAGLTVVSVDVP